MCAPKATPKWRGCVGKGRLSNRSSSRDLPKATPPRYLGPAPSPAAPVLGAHLARHRLADLFVDTLPYNAHTTASDALWAGLPLLTCLGTQFDGRVAASLLQTIGLPELVVPTMDDYEAMALALAREP